MKFAFSETVQIMGASNYQDFSFTIDKNVILDVISNNEQEFSNKRAVNVNADTINMHRLICF